MSGNSSPDRGAMDNQEPPVVSGANTLMVPIGAAYMMVIGIVGTVAGGGFYMGSLQRQIESHTERLHDIEESEKSLKRELAESLKPIRNEIQSALDAQRRDTSERRQISDQSAERMQAALQDVNKRLIRFEAQINFIAAQIPPASSYVAGPNRR